MFEGLNQPRCWAVDVGFDGKVRRCLRVAFADVPRDALPETGTLLLPTMASDWIDLEGRIRELDLDRLSFDLREVGTGEPNQTFVFEQDLFDDVIQLSLQQVRVRVAGSMLPGRRVAFASKLSRM